MGLERKTSAKLQPNARMILALPGIGGVFGNCPPYPAVQTPPARMLGVVLATWVLAAMISGNAWRRLASLQSVLGAYYCNNKHHQAS